MPEMTYFVTYKLYNGDSKGWAYKFELKTTDKDEAEKKFHELLTTYIGKAPYTLVSVEVTNQKDESIFQRTWEKIVPAVEDTTD